MKIALHKLWAPKNCGPWCCSTHGIPPKYRPERSCLLLCCISRIRIRIMCSYYLATVTAVADDCELVFIVVQFVWLRLDDVGNDVRVVQEWNARSAWMEAIYCRTGHHCNVVVAAVAAVVVVAVIVIVDLFIAHSHRVCNALKRRVVSSERQNRF